MKRSFCPIVAVCLLLTASSVCAFTPAHLWSERFGGVTTDVGSAVAVDASGNVIVAGYFEDTVNFGGANLTSAGGADIFIAKYSPAGVHQWSQRFGSTLADYAHDIAIDASGNIIVTGRFTGTVDFGGGNLTSAGSNDIFLAKYNSAGVHQWSQRFGAAFTDYPFAVAVDASGNIAVTGYFAGTVDFGGGNLISAGANDIFVAVYNSGGVHQWSQGFGDITNDNGAGVGFGTAGDVFVSGRFEGTVDFGGGNLTSAGSTDIFVAKYNSSGAHQWSRRYGGPGLDSVGELVVDVSDNVAVTGYFSGMADFGGGNLISAGSFDVFVAKYNSAGVHQWSQRFGGSTNEFGNAITTDSSGNVFISGGFASTASFGGGNLIPAGSTDIYFAKYDPSGVHQWSMGFGGTLPDAGLSVAVDGQGNASITGYFHDTVNFGGGDLSSVGEDDLFLAKYSASAAAPVITSITDIGNDQGKKVKIRFDRSGVDDADATVPVTRYVAFRRDDPAPVSPVAAPDPMELAAGWTQVGSVFAFAEDSYGIDVPTIGDSTISQGQYYSVFYVRAATDVPSRFFDSDADSGYSLDNLAPGVPSSFALIAGILSWDESTAADFDYFTVYGAATNDFGLATVVDYTVATSIDVTASPYAYYFVTATDFSGNEGGPATLASATGVGDTPRSYVLSVTNYPNPFNPRTTVRYTVPGPGKVRVTIHDVRGARIATLVDGEEREARGHRIEWDGRSDGGTRVSSGVYFVRIEYKNAVISRKMVLAK